MKKYIFESFYQFNDYIINQIENNNLLCIVFVTDDQYESVAAATFLQSRFSAHISMLDIDLDIESLLYLSH